MTIEEQLDKGFKRPVNLTLFEREIGIIDHLCQQHRCSRAAVIGAWAREYADLNLTGKVKAGRRPGAGRKPSKGK